MRAGPDRQPRRRSRQHGSLSRGLYGVAISSQSVAEGDDIARSIGNCERLSGILWIGLGALQLIAVVTAVAGAWNIWAGISRLAMSKRVRAREAAMPQAGC